MTRRQKILRRIYPLLMAIKNFSGRSKAVLANTSAPLPPVSFYSLSAELIGGGRLEFSDFNGKKVLLVNTASNCGYTAQLAELGKLQQQMKGRLVVVGFPSNDFGQQEKRADDEIAAFCNRHYSVSFPMSKKTVVTAHPQQHAVYRWLSSPHENGWCSRQPQWNFSKYLVSEEGRLTHYFAPWVSPLSPTFINAFKQSN